MSEPIWKQVRPTLPGALSVYWREMPDGSQQSCTEDDPSFLRWLEEGNTPLPPDPIPEPEPLTAQQKLEAAGLTVEELKGLLGL